MAEMEFISGNHTTKTELDYLLAAKMFRLNKQSNFGFRNSLITVPKLDIDKQ